VLVNIEKENAMRNESTYHQDEKETMRNLAESRRWLNFNGLRQFELPDPERERRVEEYARQVAEHGAIVQWLPASEPRDPAYRSRFADGDALRA
jgi:hypothetical protein